MGRPKTPVGIITTATGKRFPVKMFTEATFKQALKPYGALIGQISFTWNLLHENLSHLFHVTLESKNSDISYAIWFSTDSDFQQRKFLRAAIDKTTVLNSSQKEDVRWLLNKIDDKLRHNRNDALHAPLMITKGVVDDALITWAQVHISTRSPRAVALRGKDIKVEFENYQKLASVLATFATQMHFALTNVSLGVSWPKKPQLPDAHKKKASRAHRPAPVK